MLSNVNLLISHRRTDEYGDRFWFIDEELVCQILGSGIKVFANKDLIKDEKIFEHELFHHSASFAEFSGQMTAEGSGLTEMLPGLDTSSFRTQIHGPHFYMINPDELNNRMLPSVNALYLVDSDQDIREHQHIETIDLDFVMDIMRKLVAQTETKTMTRVTLGEDRLLTYNAGVSGHEFMFWVGTCIGNRYKRGQQSISLKTMREMITTSSVDSRLAMASLFFLAMGYGQDNDKEVSGVTKEVCDRPLSVFPKDAHMLDCISLGLVGDGSDLDGFVVFDVLWAPNNVMRLGINTDDDSHERRLVILNSCDAFDAKTKDTCLDLKKYNLSVLKGNLLEMFYLEAVHAATMRPSVLVRGWTLANAAVVQSIISGGERPAANI